MAVTQPYLFICAAIYLQAFQSTDENSLSSELVKNKFMKLWSPWFHYSASNLVSKLHFWGTFRDRRHYYKTLSVTN